MYLCQYYTKSLKCIILSSIFLAFTQVPRTESTPLQIATMMSMIKHEIKTSNGHKEKLNVHQGFFIVTTQTSKTIQPSKAGLAGIVLLVTLKNLDGNLTFH